MQFSELQSRDVTESQREALTIRAQAFKKLGKLGVVLSSSVADIASCTIRGFCVFMRDINTADIIEDDRGSYLINVKYAITRMPSTIL